MPQVLTISLVILFSNVALAQIAFIQDTIAFPHVLVENLQAVDMDLDGDIDILSCTESLSGIFWMENDGNENFTVHSTAVTGDTPIDAYAADVDSDGDMDIVNASWTDGILSWFENDGNMGFTEHILESVPGAAGPIAVLAVDIDQDNDVDVLSARFGLMLFINDGQQNFTVDTIGFGSTISSIQTIDFDGDLDTDVVYSANGSDEIWLLINNGGQSFTAHLIANFTGVISVIAKDIDDDSDLDIVAGSVSLNNVSWFENLGSLQFQQHVVSTSTMQPTTVTAADIDHNGQMDIVASSHADHTVRWFQNNGSQNFNETIISTNIWGANSILAVDLDDDLDLDIVTGGLLDFKVLWFQNVSPTVGVSENTNASIVIQRIFPNPVNDVATVQFNLRRPEVVRLEITNSRGQLVLQHTVDLPVGRNDVELNLEHLATGSYMMKLISREGIAVTPVLIGH